MSKDIFKIVAGAMVPRKGRVTITQKSNGRMYLGCDEEVFVILIKTIQRNRNAKWEPPAAQAAHDRLLKTVDAYAAQHLEPTKP